MMNGKQRLTKKEAGYLFRIGNRGFELFPKDPNGKIYRLYQWFPLDGWISDPKEVQNALIQDGFRTKRVGDEVYILEDGEE